ncbi:MAG: P-loop NTPase fold protein [Hydrogenophaga sp.]|jgi:formylglycine-generating enzyme required for sulfatase activity|nr:P-loop NTPase fold protein [Hydrogenophaga sp.]
MADDTEKDNGDYLGYGVYAETLWARVISALDRDHQGERRLGDDPLVVGIFGEWGAGKSTLLKLIERHAVELAQERAAWRKHDGGNFSLTVPVFFQPWKYEHEPHLHVPILLHILAALKQHMEQAQTPAEWAQGKVPEAIKKHMDLLVGTFGLLLAGAAFAMDTSVPLSSRVALAGAGLLAKVLPKLNPDANKEELAKALEHKENGRFFYEMHETLQAITRPRRYAKHLTGVDLSTEVSINFVIFIDDLDRCLPEKAVETLELIKTVFNLESFAFVLALDEEVVERGIGHRYKDYALVNKKPEMPITGFEYLEKIVHLPFRLPALSRREGMKFLQAYERELLKERSARGSSGYQAAPWFAEPEAGDSARFHLGHAVVNAFDAYVPRKLIRVVELFHQVVEVAHERGRPVDDHLGGERDPRWVLVFVMLQLFHPDLYRLMRRQGLGVDILRDSFSDGLLRPDMADMDLLAWACYQTQPVPNLASATEAISAIKDDEGKRYPAQRLRLPIAERLLEHRAVQRHVFDPLKLFAGIMEASAPFDPASTRVYFSLLGQLPDEADVLSPLPVHWPASARGEDFPLGIEVNGEHLFVTLTSAEPSERRALASALGLKPGQKLSSHQVQALIGRTNRWLKAGNSDRGERLLRLQDGLCYLAPFVAAADGSALWALSKMHKPDWERATPFSDVESLKKATRAADLYAALGLDDRFDPGRFHLPKSRWSSNSPEQEPLEGFVKVFSDLSKALEDFERITGQQIEVAPFAMARYPTTVDQFAHFVAGHGYGDPAGAKPEWWDTLGWQWRTGELDSTAQVEWVLNGLAQRPAGELRSHPMEWSEQRLHGSRPVMNLNWFEARAYAGWLTKQMRDRKLIASGQEFRLPLEAECELTACTADMERFVDQQYPWQVGGPEQAHLRGNLSTSGIESLCPTGIFAPSPVGVFDLDGNAWEWQNTFFKADGSGKDLFIDRDIKMLKFHESQDQSDLPVLRGKAINQSGEGRRGADRYRLPPLTFARLIGFRLVLSRPQDTPES